MSKFNETKKNDVRNLAGGKAYKESDEMQLASLLLTSFGDDKHYQKEKDIYSQLEQLIAVCDKEFVAKAIIYARKQFGMRTITHIASSMLAKHIGGMEWGSRFFDKVINRVDDMTEIVACHLSRKQKLTNAMKKGFSSALGRFDDYQLAKYKGENKALNALLNESAIKKSLVLPFRFSTAYDEMSKIDSDAMRAVSKACEIACSNVPKLDGKTLIALDVSGSMSSCRVADIASLFTAVLLKSNDCDLITFADDAKYRIVDPYNSVMTIKNAIRYACGGTNFESVFRVANKRYDRVILLSDMQAWLQDSWYAKSPKAAYERYKREFNVPNCKFYSFDLAGYGTMQMPQQDVYCLAGFSDKIFDIMKLVESDKNALVNTIKAVEL